MYLSVSSLEMIRKITSIILAILMLTTNMSITFATHYCGGKAVKSSFLFGQSELSCGMTDSGKKKSACKNHNPKETLSKKRCCENKYTTLSVDDDYNETSIVSPNIDFKFVTAFVVFYVNNYFFEKKGANSFFAHSPPLIEQDRSVLFQVFRI